VWAARRGDPPPADRRLARLVAESPFRNVGPGIGYVGAAACARCHADVAKSYRAHPMGRSVATVAAAIGRRDEAVALLWRAAAVNPYCADYPRRLAVLHAEMSRWTETAGSARVALGLDLSLVDARIALVVSEARRGEIAAARNELRRLHAFDPGAADALRRALFAGGETGHDH
jgi:hypothetical protein